MLPLIQHLDKQQMSQSHPRAIVRQATPLKSKNLNQPPEPRKSVLRENTHPQQTLQFLLQHHLCQTKIQALPPILPTHLPQIRLLMLLRQLTLPLTFHKGPIQQTQPILQIRLMPMPLRLQPLLP